MLTYINYEMETTLTVLDQDEHSDRLISLFYVRSPNRTCSNVMAKLGQSPKDRLDKFPTKYLGKLHFEHLVYVVERDERLRNYWEKIKDKPHYFITENQFPLRYNRGFEDYIHFVEECEPSNLVYDLVPYQYVADFTREINKDEIDLLKKEWAI